MVESSGLQRRIGLGTYPLGGGYGPIDEGRAIATIHAAIAHGWTFIDTGESYGEAEPRIGRALKGRRSEVVLATKIYPNAPYTFPHLLSSVENSLRRLRTDHIDLYQLHAPENTIHPIPVTPARELAENLGRLIETGKVANVGLSNFPRHVVAEIAAHLPIFSVQDVYNLYDNEHADDLLPWSKRHSVAFLAYSVLAQGLLGDGMTPERSFRAGDRRQNRPRFRDPALRHYAEGATRLAELAADHGLTLPMLAVAWVLRTSSVSVALLGAKGPGQVRQLASCEQIALSDELAAAAEGIARQVRQRVAEASSARL